MYTFILFVWRIVKFISLNNFFMWWYFFAHDLKHTVMTALARIFCYLFGQIRLQEWKTKILNLLKLNSAARSRCTTMHLVPPTLGRSWLKISLLRPKILAKNFVSLFMRPLPFNLWATVEIASWHWRIS